MNFKIQHFSFWVIDRLRRHRSLSQCSVYFRQHPNDTQLTLEELNTMLRNGNIKPLLGRKYAYKAQIVGSDAYWHKRQRELEAVLQPKGPGTAFFTVSFADNHWDDLHRLMPGGQVEPNRRYQNISKNPHLADWYFLHKLEKFIHNFFKS